MGETTHQLELWVVYDGEGLYVVGDTTADMGELANDAGLDACNRRMVALTLTVPAVLGVVASGSVSLEGGPVALVSEPVEPPN